MNIQEILPNNHYEKVNFDTNLYRIGVPNDGSCFFHSVLTCIDPFYHSYNDKKKKDEIQNIRTRIADRLSINDFFYFTANGTPLYKDLPTEVNKYKKEFYELDQADIKTLAKDLSSIANHFTEETMKEFVSLYIAFKEYIRNPKQYVSDELRLLVSREIGYDIYILGYTFHSPSLTYKDRVSIIIHNVNEKHWEPIVRKEDNGFITSFDATDKLIISLYNHHLECWNTLLTGIKDEKVEV